MKDVFYGVSEVISVKKFQSCLFRYIDQVIETGVPLGVSWKDCRFRIELVKRPHPSGGCRSPKSKKSSLNRVRGYEPGSWGEFVSI